jgi:hypothetical protein
MVSSVKRSSAAATSTPSMDVPDSNPITRHEVTSSGYPVHRGARKTVGYFLTKSMSLAVEYSRQKV